jgi:hypothetical protein
MKITAALLVVVAALTPAGPPRVASETSAEARSTDARPDEHALQQQIVSKEREELDALKTGNGDVFAGLLGEEAVFLDAHGPASKAEIVKNTAEFRLQEYAMTDVRFLPLSAKSGLIAYRLAEKGTSHGKEFTGEVYVSALWARQGPPSGKWICLFSQETAAK